MLHTFLKPHPPKSCKWHVFGQGGGLCLENGMAGNGWINVIVAFSDRPDDLIIPAPASLWSPEARAAGPLELPLTFMFFFLKARKLQ